MLSNKALDDFKRIWKEEYGEEIDDEKATRQAINLLTFFNAIYRPLRKEWIEDKK